MTDQLPKKETPRAAAAYELYSAMPPGTRSLKLLAEQLSGDPSWSSKVQSRGKAGVNLSTIESWSSDFKWQDRVKVDDKERARQKIEAQQRALDEMNARHAELAVETLGKAIRLVNARLDSDEFGNQPLVILIKEMLATERLARGDVEKKLIELTGKDGGAIESVQHVLVYLPQQEEDDE